MLASDSCNSESRNVTIEIEMVVIVTVVIVMLVMTVAIVTVVEMFSGQRFAILAIFFSSLRVYPPYLPTVVYDLIFGGGPP